MRVFHRGRRAIIPLLLCALAASAQNPTVDTGQLSKEDARLNQLYQQRVAQVKSEPAALSALRAGERDWIRQRDHQCGKDTACLTQNTKARADYLQDQVAQNDQTAKPGTPIPEVLIGKWVVRKQILNSGVTCWDEKQAQSVVGTVLEYQSDRYLWKDKSLRNTGSTTTMVKAQEFADNNAGGSAGGSMTFAQLGITATDVKQIEIQHPDVAVYDKSSDCCATAPGETVLLKGPNTIVFSLCGIFYEATRAR